MSQLDDDMIQLYDADEDCVVTVSDPARSTNVVVMDDDMTRVVVVKVPVDGPVTTNYYRNGVLWDTVLIEG